MVLVVAGKEHKSGVSKAGKAYDFIVIHTLAPRKGVIGKAAVEKIVDASVIGFDDILVNQAYDCDIDLDGNICAMLVAKS